MKITKLRASLASLILLAFAFTGLPASGQAIITKADNTNALGQAASWVGGLAPTATDIAVWSGTYSASPDNPSGLTNSLRAVNSGTALSWQGIRVGSLSGTALTTNTIYWGTSGYGAETNISAATQSGNIVTITTKAQHGYAPGQSVTIAGVTPSGYNGTYTIVGIPSNTQFTYSNAVSGLAAGTAFGTVEGAIYIGGAGTTAANSSYTIGSSGIDLSAATHSASMVATGFAFAGNQTWTTAPGRVIRFGSSGVNSASAKAVSSGSDGTIDISGSGIVDGNQGGGTGMADAGGFTGFTGKWRVNSGATLRGLRNGATAWGSSPDADSITLNGGTLAVGGISGAVGNWTWTNAITLASGTTSALDNQNVAGSGRYLKLNGPISGSGNLVFKDTLLAGTFSNPDNGFILTGPNTMSGTVTIGGPTENGIAGRLTYVRLGGIGGDSTANGIGVDGSLGTATIVNNGILTFSLNGAITVNTISGTGSLRVGYNTTVGAESQNVTLTGVNTYSGYTRINMGTLTLPAGASIPNTSDIFLTPLTGASMITVTLDVTQNGGLTLNNGQRLVGGPNNASLNNGAQVSGNVTAGTGSAIVPGGTNVANTLVINGDLTLTGGATLVYDVGNTTATSDLITVANLNPSGVTTFAVTPPGTGLFAGTYPLIQVSGALNGSPANFTVSGLDPGPRGQTFSIVYDTTTPGAYTVNLVVVGSPGALVWQGNGVNNNWDAGVTKDWSNTVSSASDFFYPGDLVTFDDTGLNAPAINLTGVLRPGTVTINSLQSYTFSGAGQIAGPTSLAVSNSGTLTLLTSNNFTGPMIVTGGGILAITNETALNQPVIASAQSLTLDNGGALMVTNTLIIGANTNRGIIIGTGGGGLIVNNGATLTVSNIIGDLTGASILTKTGNGTLILSGNNNYGNGSSGSLDATIVNGGTVIYGSAAGLSRAGNTSGTSGFFAVPFELASGVVDLNGQISYQPNFATGTAATGTGVILYNGTVNINGLAGVPLTFQDSGGTPTGWGSAAATVLHYLADNNPSTMTISARFAAVGTSSASTRTFTVDDSSATAIEVDITAPLGVTVINSTNQDGRNVTLVKEGAGTLRISAANNFPGWQVNNGTLLVNHLQALGGDRTLSTGVSGGSGSMNLLTVAGGVVDLNGFSPALGGINDNGSASGTIRNDAGAASTLAIGLSGTNSASGSYGGVIENGTGSVALVKVGSGMQILAGANTYTGGTSVSNGTLVVNGSLAGTVAVRSGATLAGTGTLAGTVTVDDGGTLAPGTTTIGTLTLGNSPVLNGAVRAEIDRNGGTPLADQLAVAGSPIAYNGTLVVANIGAPLQPGDTFQLFSASSYSGGFTLVSMTPGQIVTWNTSNLAANGTISVGSVAAPFLTTAVVGGNLELSWPIEALGAQLLVQTNAPSVGLSTDWVVWTGSTTTNQISVPIDPAVGSVFLRLVYPPQP